MMFLIGNGGSYEVSTKVENECLLGLESQLFRNSKTYAGQWVCCQNREDG